MRQTARGTFTVDVSQRPQDPDAEGLGQMQLRKTWSGDVERALLVRRTPSSGHF